METSLNTSMISTKIVLKCPEWKYPLTRDSAHIFMKEYKIYYQNGGDVHVTRAMSEEALRLLELVDEDHSSLGDINAIYYARNGLVDPRSAAQRADPYRKVSNNPFIEEENELFSTNIGLTPLKMVMESSKQELPSLIPSPKFAWPASGNWYRFGAYASW